MENKYDETQLLKGVLEGCVLVIIQREKTYGYQIIQELKPFGFDAISEGTIYPLLIRFEKKGIVSSHFEKSPFGPKRKYYSITKKGKVYLKEFIENWKSLSRKVECLLKGENNEYCEIKKRK